MEKFISKLQVHLNHGAEVIFGEEASMYLLNSNMGDVQEYHATIWCAMGGTMKKLISYELVLDNLNLDLVMKEAR